jgi:3-oxoacyl-[acyl-carrier protein] reductase
MEGATPLTTELAGKTALITGAGRGTGRVVSFGLAVGASGSFCSPVSGDQLAQTARELTAAGSAEPLVFSADVGDDRRYATR